MKIVALRLAAAPLLLIGATALAADPPAADDAQFFSRQVLPILKSRCYECHSHDAGKIQGGLTVDSRDGLVQGGDSGPAVVSKHLDQSLLITAVRYDDASLQMPPDDKLPDNEIAVLESWVRRGAYDPRATAAGVGRSDEIWAKASAHWAFQPITRPRVPEVENSTWARTPIDAFVLAKLEAKELRPSPAADKRTWIRRATYDLIGLPPTSAEVEAFLDDNSPEAHAQVIDRLLASPHYGERWGRFWLDIARYADTTGENTLGGRVENRLVYAYTYRDYVIRAFNDDKPFDRFILEQLAADQLKLAGDQEPLAALGFITVGKRFSNNKDDLIDDRIDVVSRGLLGLTVACARCHDHKFDPIPTEDYYSWHGIFANSTEPKEGPVVEAVEPSAQEADFQVKVAEAQHAADEFEDTQWNVVLSTAWQKLDQYLITIHEFSRGSKGLSLSSVFRQRSMSPNIGRAWSNYMQRVATRQHSPVFAPWVAFSKLTDEQFASEAKPLATRFAANKDKRKPIHPLVAKLFAGEPPASIKDVAERYGRLFARIDDSYQQQRTRLLQQAGAWQPVEVKLADPVQAALCRFLYGPAAIMPRERLVFQAEAGLRKAAELGRLVAKVNDIKLSHPGSPGRAMVLEDVPDPKNSRVFIRGDRNKVGPEVPRQFLKILSGSDRQPFQHGSGRLELAEAIANPNNPLTARVIVNRVWQHHFGQGLVTTPSDFGLRGEPPTHPALLDYLARSFIDEGWSLKKLHRLIMLSAVYGQSSDSNPKYAVVDPGNTLLWRMNRTRLDFEALRDTILAVTGSLDPTVGGRSVDILSTATRRTIYAHVDRLNLAGVFTTFDFAQPEMSTPQRFETTVPTQALFLMNSPLVIEQARKLAASSDLTSLADDPQRVHWLYRRFFQREPTSQDLEDALAFVRAQAERRVEAPPVATWKYGSGSYSSNKKLVVFNEAKRFAHDEWLMPGRDHQNNFIQAELADTGGLTGGKRGSGVIRRWVAPVAGTIRVEGTLALGKGKHPGGVLAQVVLSRFGESPQVLGRFDSDGRKMPTRIREIEVQPGDFVDFIVVPTSERQESFDWAPVIDLEQSGPRAAGRHQWNAQADFDGPQPPPPIGLSPWEKYIQALLLTNELAFVN
ncbi:MAG TPA: PSD1 and planctomycete cytochrome C domain-containing protein [Pirellulales bacterium]|jgi:hypothetical protein|nr:PSD1 and planctomycete cytochrome C domain-containing protein [Pirellulales bacterium]